MRRLLLLVLGLTLLTLDTVQALEVSIDPPTLEVLAGSQFRTVAHAQGGQPPYRFEWFVGGERTGEVNQTRMWCIKQPGNYVLRVVATDRRGQRREASALLTVITPRIAMRKVSANHIEVTIEAMTPPFRCTLFVNEVASGTEVIRETHRRFQLPSPDARVRFRVVDANNIEAWGQPVGGEAERPEPDEEEGDIL